MAGGVNLLLGTSLALHVLGSLSMRSQTTDNNESHFVLRLSSFAGTTDRLLFVEVHTKDTLRFFSGASDTDDMRQQKLLKLLKLGLVRYFAKTPLMEDANVYFSTKEAQTQAADDPWNNWVFNTDLSVQLTGQRATNSAYLSGSLSANRITEDLKIRLGLSGSYAEDNFTVADELFKSLARSQ